MCRHYCSKYFQNSRCSIKTTRFGVWLVPLFFWKKKRITNVLFTGVGDEEERRSSSEGGAACPAASGIGKPRFVTALHAPDLYMVDMHACRRRNFLPPQDDTYTIQRVDFVLKKWMCVEGDNSTHESYKPTYLQKGTYVPMRTNSSGWLGSLAYG
jgi:hypothetical protein